MLKKIALSILCSAFVFSLSKSYAQDNLVTKIEKFSASSVNEALSDAQNFLNSGHVAKVDFIIVSGNSVYVQCSESEHLILGVTRRLLPILPATLDKIVVNGRIECVVTGENFFLMIGPLVPPRQ